METLISKTLISNQLLWLRKQFPKPIIPNQFNLLMSRHELDTAARTKPYL